MVKKKETKKEVKEEKKTTHKKHHKKEEKKEIKKKELKKKEVKVEKKIKRRKRKSKKGHVTLAKGKRKSAIARATISKGTGRISINGISIEAINNKYMKEILKEPLHLLGHKEKEINVKINVKGGGMMGQIQAARTALAKAIVEYFEDEKLKDAFMEYDRSLIVDDVRQVEPKKYRGPKARARFQKSYR